jgi:hypothetical protein
VSVTLERKLARRRMTHRIDTLLPLDLSKETAKLEVTPAPIGKYGLWKVKGMQFPPYFQNVRNALIRNGHSVADASKITWGAIRHWARAKKTSGEYGKGVHPEVVAAARAALAGIAKDSARAHAQSASHAHANVVDQLVLREFSRSGRVVELADPYHSNLGKFTSAGNQGSAAPKIQTNRGTGNTTPKAGGTKPISAKQKARYLKLARELMSRATTLRAEAAKLNLQMQALSALIAQQTKFLATAATGATASGTGTATAAGTKTAAAKTGTATAAATSTKIGVGTATSATPADVQRNTAQLKQLTNTRNQLLSQANKLAAEAAVYVELSKGQPVTQQQQRSINTRIPANQGGAG